MIPDELRPVFQEKDQERSSAAKSKKVAVPDNSRAKSSYRSCDATSATPSSSRRLTSSVRKDRPTRSMRVPKLIVAVTDAFTASSGTRALKYRGLRQGDSRCCDEESATSSLLISLGPSSARYIMFSSVVLPSPLMPTTSDTPGWKACSMLDDASF